MDTFKEKLLDFANKAFDQNIAYVDYEGDDGECYTGEDGILTLALPTHGSITLTTSNHTKIRISTSEWGHIELLEKH